MSPDRNDKSSIKSSRTVDQTISNITCSRRRLLVGGIAAGGISLAGCTSDEPSSTSEAGDGASEPTHEETTEQGAAGEDTPNDEDTDETLADAERVVTEYLLAAVEEDVDRMSELAHSRNPLDPVMWIESGWEFRGGGDEEELDTLETEIIDEEASIDDVFELEGASFWFEREELADELDAERLVTIELRVDDPTEDDMHWVIATENDEWRYLFGAPIDSTPENPEELFEEPIEDENNDVVVGIDWEHDRMGDVPQAAVELTDERGIDASRIEVETTIEGASSSVFDRDDEEFTANWEGVTLFIGYHEEGDQVVVTAINEEAGESQIVHREHFEP